MSVSNAVLRKFWKDEATNFPRWFCDGTNSNNVTWDEFKAFCERMWKIYKAGDALVYVEDVDGHAFVHFSLLRGGTIGDLTAIRDEIHKEFPFIFGWVGKHNRGLRKLMGSLGFRWDGLKMYQGQSHGRMLEYHCYIKRLEKQPELC